MAEVGSFFSRHANVYEEVAGVQRSVATALASRLPDVESGGAKILEVGCGTGFLTRHLPPERVLAIDAAPGMVARCRARCPGVEVREFNFLHDPIVLDGPFSLIVSSAAFHWMEPLELAARRVYELLERKGQCGISMMVEGTLGELHAARAEVAPDVLPLRALPSVEGVARAFRSAGFSRVELRVQEWHTRHERGWDLLRDLHRGGMTGGEVSRGKRLLNRGELQAVAERLESTGDGVISTYRVATVFCVNSCKDRLSRSTNSV